MMMMHAAKEQSCRQIESLLSASFDDGVFKAKNLMFFEHAMDRDPGAAHRAYRHVASLSAKVADHYPQESLEDAVKRVLYEVSNDMLAGELSLGSQGGFAMENSKASFDRGMVKRQKELREEGVLLPGMEDHLEARFTIAVMMAETLASESKSYAKQIPQIVDHIKASLPDILAGSHDMTLGKAMFSDPQDVKDLVDDSHFTVRVGIRASSLGLADLEHDVKVAKTTDVIRRDMDDSGPSR